MDAAAPRKHPSVRVSSVGVAREDGVDEAHFRAEVREAMHSGAHHHHMRLLHRREKESERRGSGETRCVRDTAHKDIAADAEEEEETHRVGNREAPVLHLVYAEGRRGTRKEGGAAHNRAERRDGWKKGIEETGRGRKEFLTIALDRWGVGGDRKKQKEGGTTCRGARSNKQSRETNWRKRYDEMDE